GGWRSPRPPSPGPAHLLRCPHRLGADHPRPALPPGPRRLGHRRAHRPSGQHGLRHPEPHLPPPRRLRRPEAEGRTVSADLDLLIGAYLDGWADAATVADLEGRLRQSSEARRRFTET